MKKVLLTGATGFIGSHCLRPLSQKGYKVIAFSSKQHDLLSKGSVVSMFKEVQPSHLLHLAWYTEPPHYWHSPLNFDWHEASFHLLNHFYKAGGQRAVIAGTCAEYEWGYPFCDEKATPCRPATFYGAAKLSLSILAEQLARLEKKSLAWARLFHLFGPQENPERLVPFVIRELLKGNKVPCSHGRQIRDYLHVQDAADALCALLDGSVEGPVNIGSGCSVKICDLIEKIAKKIGNKDLVQLGSIPANPLDPPILVPSILRLKKEVEWEPKMDLEAGIEHTLSWWENEIHY